MRSKLGTALDIFILLIGPFIIYARIVDISREGVSLYPLLSIVIVGIALGFAVYNLIHILKTMQSDRQQKK
ncbi:MAG: hypothetical protein ACQEV0_05750 [Bacillota bacterium]